VFVKELTERFSRWYNRHRDWRGTLWMERFRSVLVEDGGVILPENHPRQYFWWFSPRFKV
jgi:hypothetical protein